MNFGLTELHFKRGVKKFTSPWMTAEGSFTDNRLQGTAHIRYANGADFLGEFDRGVIEGFCRFRDRQLTVEGIWRDNVLTKQY